MPPRTLQPELRIVSRIRRVNNSARVPISSAVSPAISGMRHAHSKMTCRSQPAASIRRPNMSTRPPRKSATEASAISSMARRILRSGSLRLFLVCRCSPVSPLSAS